MIDVWMFQDEHGQSMLHFAAARSHGRNALFQLLQETDINVGYRDELYRTARDVAIQANLPENIQDIDKWVLYMAARGKRT
jgi:ankyrin repeat protein